VKLALRDHATIPEQIKAILSHGETPLSKLGAASDVHSRPVADTERLVPAFQEIMAMAK
jgi:hypothetical protein